MGICTSYVTPPQDVMFGISQANIVVKLNKRNWKTKAICRVMGEEDNPRKVPVYIWVKKGERSAEGEKETIYTVGIYVLMPEKTFAKEHFLTLEEALSYANGEDGGDLGYETRPAKGPHEYPPDSDPPYVISGMRVDRDRYVPKWSYRPAPPHRKLTEAEKEKWNSKRDSS